MCIYTMPSKQYNHPISDLISSTFEATCDYFSESFEAIVEDVLTRYTQNLIENIRSVTNEDINNSSCKLAAGTSSSSSSQIKNVSNEKKSRQLLLNKPSGKRRHPKDKFSTKSTKKIKMDTHTRNEDQVDLSQTATNKMTSDDLIEALLEEHGKKNTILTPPGEEIKENQANNEQKNTVNENNTYEKK